MSIQLENILNKPFALRRLLRATKYHNSKGSIPKSELVDEKEPELRNHLTNLAQQIVANPNLLIIDDYSLQELKKDWKSLLKKQVINDEGDIIYLDSRSRPGHDILDHHMNHFYDVANWKGVSLKSLIKPAEVEDALLTNVAYHSTPYKSEIRRMLIMNAGLANVSKYRTTTTKSIVQYFNASAVFDPCVGWGGRMLGCLSANSSTQYLGCEPDPNTAAALRSILSEEAIPESDRQRAAVIEKPVESYLPELISNNQTFDMILTSPPYFNLEVYTAGPQSIAVHPSWADWTNKWLKPVILGCLQLLKANGTSCWSVKNFRSDKNYPLADLVIQIHKDAGWKCVKEVKMTGSARMGSKRIVDGKEARCSEEVTYCFKRITA